MARLYANRKHFVHPYGEQPDHAGIIACTFDPDFVGQAERIHTVIDSRAQLSGQLIRVRGLKTEGSTPARGEVVYNSLRAP